MRKPDIKIIPPFIFFKKRLYIPATNNMKVKFKIPSSDLRHYNTIFSVGLGNSINHLDYADFYNMSIFLKMIADKIYKLQFSPKKDVTICIDLNIYRTLKTLYAGMDIYSESISYSSMLLSFFNEGDRQVMNIEHLQRTFYSKMLLYNLKKIS